MRLVCFHHAGGSPSSFRPWMDAFAAHVELLAVRLPGREARLRETPLTEVAQIVEPLAEAIAPLLADTPVVLFGHSMGSLLAFELARELRRRSLPAPRALVVSGRNAPGTGRRLRLHALPDRELIEEVQRIYGGIPQALLDEPELLALTLPVLRADLTLNEGHEIGDEPPLDVPIRAYSGIDDPHASLAGLAAWAAFTRADFESERCAGDHFYLAPAAGKAWLISRLARLLGSQARCEEHQ